MHIQRDDTEINISFNSMRRISINLITGFNHELVCRHRNFVQHIVVIIDVIVVDSGIIHVTFSMAILTSSIQRLTFNFSIQFNSIHFF